MTTRVKANIFGREIKNTIKESSSSYPLGTGNFGKQIRIDLTDGRDKLEWKLEGPGFIKIDKIPNIGKKGELKEGQILEAVNPLCRLNHLEAYYKKPGKERR